MTRREIFSNSMKHELQKDLPYLETPSKTFDVFLNDLGINRDGVSDDGKASSEWAGKSSNCDHYSGLTFEVRWGIATHMNKEQQRKIIGNSLAVIIFNDSGSTLPALYHRVNHSLDKPLDISRLDLGEATNFICVVQKHYKYYRYEHQAIARCSSRQVRIFFALCTPKYFG